MKDEAQNRTFLYLGPVVSCPGIVSPSPQSSLMVGSHDCPSGHDGRLQCDTQCRQPLNIDNRSTFDVNKDGTIALSDVSLFQQALVRLLAPLDAAFRSKRTGHEWLDTRGFKAVC